jgi:regulator of replication initiation timing
MQKLLYSIAFTWLISCYENPACSINHELLLEGADTFSHKISCKIIPSASLINNYIEFLDEADLNTQKVQKYLEDGKFMHLYDKYTAMILEEPFKKFADICKLIYTNNIGIEPLYQAAAGMMLENVALRLESSANSSNRNAQKLNIKNDEKENLKKYPSSKRSKHDSIKGNLITTIH